MALVRRGLISYAVVEGDESEIDRLVDYAVRAAKQAYKFTKDGAVAVNVYEKDGKYRGGDVAGDRISDELSAIADEFFDEEYPEGETKVS